MAGLGSPFTRKALVSGGGGGGSSVLATMLAGMTSGQWLEMTGSNRPANMDAGLLDAHVSGDEENTITFAGHCSYNPITNEVWGVGADHDTLQNGSFGDATFWRWDIATNTFLTPVYGITGGSHQYQHSLTNETTGDYYLLSLDEAMIGKWNGSTNFTSMKALPIGVSGHIATASEWWPGKGAAWFEGVGQTCRIYNPTTDSWSTFASSLTPYAGVYHNVSAYSSVYNCVFHGGGNGGGAPVNGSHPAYYLNTRIYRLDANGTNTYIADAPYHLGVQGMTLSGDGAGDILLIGNNNWEVNSNECWKVTGAGTLTHVADPPSTTLMTHAWPNPYKTNTTTCAIDVLGCMVFIDFSYPRSPDRARVYVRKA